MTGGRHGEPVQISVPVWTFSPDDPGDWTPLLQRAQMLDRIGVDRLVVSDHVVFGERLDEYGRPELGGSKGGRQPTGPDGHWLDPLIVLSHISALTTSVRLQTGILLAALRRPVTLAKEASTLDVLSGGRLDLGVGVGWQREEYEAAGLDFHTRGKLLDHTLELCRTLWTNDVASYDGHGVTFDRIHQMPKPVQGTVPIWVSGTVNRAVARRIARYGCGWIPWGPAAKDVPSAIADLSRLIDDAGGDPTDLQVIAALRPVRNGNTLDIAATVDAASEVVAGGATDLRASFVPGVPAAAEDLLGELVPAVHQLRCP